MSSTKEGAVRPVPTEDLTHSPDKPEAGFKNPDEEIVYLKNVSKKYRTVNRNFSLQSSDDKEAIANLRTEFDKVKQEVSGVVPGRASDEPVLPTMDAIPKLTIFKGGKGKDDYPYQSWRFDVNQMLKSSFPDRICRMAILRGCRGTRNSSAVVGRRFHCNRCYRCF